MSLERRVEGILTLSAGKVMSFVKNLSRWEYSRRGLGTAAAKIFQKGVGQVGEGYVQGFHDPDTPQQEFGTVSSTARSSQEFGPRRDQWVKMVDGLHAGMLGPAVPV